MERAREEAQRLFERSRRIGDRDLEQLFPGISECRGVIQAAAPPLNGIGNVQPYELIVISTICKYLNPDLVFEFGTFNGLTTLHLAMNSPESAQVVTIDLDPDDGRRHLINDDTYYISDNSVGAMFASAPERNKIQQMFGDTTTFDEKAYRGKADLIFIDAGHEYELVRSDTEKALDMLAPNGVILWHDYVFSHYGVYTWLNELSHSVQLYSIPKATLVCYQQSDTSADACSVIESLEAQTARGRTETSARAQKTRPGMIARQVHRLRKRYLPDGTRRERVWRYLRK